MTAHISRTTKIKEERGKGTLANYRPWIKAREINSIGTAHNIIDWKHGRTIELLSDGEAWLYYILRWDDDVIDIREQYPLDLEETNSIADQAHLMRVNNGEDNMTTDLLVTMRDGSYKAYSLKASKSELDIPRNIEKLWIEKCYWNEMGVPWKQLFKEDLDRNYADNIRLCVQYYDKAKVQAGDEISMLKHLIATKQINVEMKGKILDFQRLAEQYRKETGHKW